MMSIKSRKHFNPAKALRRAALAVLTASCAAALAPSAWAAGEIVIGQCAPFTGSLARTGQSMALGVSVAVQEANAKGGINGHPVKLIARDDGYDTTRTLACTQEMIRKEHVAALIGYAGTSNIAELLKQNVLAEGPTPLIAPYTGGMPLREPFNPHIFHVRASYEDEVKELVNLMVSMNGFKRIGVFYQDDALGLSGLTGVRKALKPLGLDVVGTGKYAKNTEAVDQGVKDVLAAKPQAVIMVGITRPLAVALKKLKTDAPYVMAAAMSIVDTDEMATIAGDAAVRGMGVSQVMPSPFTPGSQHRIVQDYQAAMQKFAPKETISYASFEEYVGARVLLDALAHTPAPITPGAVAKTLASTKVDLGGYRAEFAPNNRLGSRFVEITVVGRNGKTVR